MTSIDALSPEQLVSRCNPDQFSFTTTADLPELEEIVGQERALEAIRFAVDMHGDGYNLFVHGPSGLAKHTLVDHLLATRAEGELPASDWCYVNNFEETRRPLALELPAGRGRELRKDLDQLVEDLFSAISAAFEGEEYGNQLQAIKDHVEQLQEEAFERLRALGEEQGVAFIPTPAGFAFAPKRDGEVMSPDEFKGLPKEEQERIETIVAQMQAELQDVVRQMPKWAKVVRGKIRELNREVTLLAVGHLFDELRQRYETLPDVLAHLDAVQGDVVDHVDDFRKAGEENEPTFPLGTRVSPMKRYRVNVVVDHAESRGAPVVYVDNPTYQNLVGRVEHHTQMGNLLTDFTLIRAGALHQANGGYLVLDCRKLLTHPAAYEGLKRALFGKQIKIESLAEMYSLISTVSLQPSPIPLAVKVVLLGERLLYYLLVRHDPEFAKLFKVAADMEDRIHRTEGNGQQYALQIGSLARRAQLRPLDAAAVARTIEHSARATGDSERLSAHLGKISDLLREANHWAAKAGREAIGAEDIQRAIDLRIRRADRIRQRIYDEILRGTILVETDGEKTGQVNGLSVIPLGDFAFGQPARITATTRLGTGKVVDIEREVKLGGAIHSKGVLILSHFLADRYTREQPLSMSASLAFEQSYGRIEGDSASLAELCALLSALADAPIRQSLAITGSVDQQGQVQPIGGVNEKIEGFFDICQARGLTGKQGVLIPAANVKHLMLRRDVVAAVQEKRFRVWVVSTVDEAIALLTGVGAGTRDEEGEYPDGTINQRVLARLTELSTLRKRFGDAKEAPEDEQRPGDGAP